MVLSLEPPHRFEGWAVKRFADRATIDALMAEPAARHDIECRAVGGTEIALDEVAGKAIYVRYFIPNMGAPNLARLRVSNPDLFC